MSGFRRLKVGSLVLAIAGGFLTNTAFADVYIPEGLSGTALHLSSELKPVSRITGLDNVHGLSVAISRGLLIAGSLSEQSRSEVEKPGAVSSDDHNAHHGKSNNDQSEEVSIISLIDIQTEKVIRKIEVPGMVHHITTSSDDRYVLVTHPGLDAVSIIDLETNTLTATIPTGSNPNYAVYDPQTASFYVSNTGNATISQVEPKAGYAVRNFKTENGVEHLEFDIDSRRIFAAEADAGEVSVIDIDTGETTSRFTVGGGLHGIAYDQSRNSIYVSARERGAIVYISLETGESEDQLIGPEPYHMTLVGDTLLVSSADEPLIWAVDVETRHVLATIPTKDRAHQMAVTQ